jgi:hypothetical protein
VLAAKLPERTAGNAGFSNSGASLFNGSDSSCTASAAVEAPEAAMQVCPQRHQQQQSQQQLVNIY